MQYIKIKSNGAWIHFKRNWTNFEVNYFTLSLFQSLLSEDMFKYVAVFFPSQRNQLDTDGWCLLWDNMPCCGSGSDADSASVGRSAARVEQAGFTQTSNVSD